MQPDIEARVLAVEDRLAIADLRGRYCQLLDNREWDAFADLFTSEGVFDGLHRVVGRGAIHRFFSEDVPRIAEQFWHFCSNGTLDLAGDRATGRISMEYWSVTDGVSFLSAGHYDDVLERVNGQWKFASRKITFYFYSPVKDGFTGQRPGLSLAR